MPARSSPISAVGTGRISAVSIPSCTTASLARSAAGNRFACHAVGATPRSASSRASAMAALRMRRSIRTDASSAPGNSGSNPTSIPSAR
jgi:hypothetical protein